MPKSNYQNLSVDEIVNIISTTCTTQASKSAITTSARQGSVQIAVAGCKNRATQNMSVQTFTDTSVFQNADAYNSAISQIATTIVNEFVKKNEGLDLSLLELNNTQLSAMIQTTLSNTISQKQMDVMNYNSLGQQTVFQFCAGSGSGNNIEQSMDMMNQNIYDLYSGSSAINAAASSVAVNLSNKFDLETTGLIPSVFEDATGLLGGLFDSITGLFSSGIIGIIIIILVFIVVVGVVVSILVYVGLKSNPGVLTEGVKTVGNVAATTANVSKVAAKEAPMLLL
jgi:hypothetical protein